MKLVRLREGPTRDGSAARYISFSVEAWLAYVVMSTVLSATSPNFYLTFACLAVLPIVAITIWRVGEPPILFFCVAFQWLQVSAKVFDADIRGLKIEDYYSGWTVDEAIWLSLIGLLVLCVGIRMALVKFTRDVSLDVRMEVESLSAQKIWNVYLFVFLITFFGQNYIWWVPRLSQILLMAFQMKWVLFFVLALVVLGKGERYALLWVAFLLELLVGFTGFFSGYKQVFFVLSIVLMTFIRQLDIKIVGRLLVLAIAVLYLTVIWSAVKQDYRDYVSQGTGRQAVLVSIPDQMSKLLELYAEANREEFEFGVEALAKRIAYVDYFARVLEMVPSSMPHSNGELWGRAFVHILTPRLLFPDKPALVSDTLETQRFTGYRLIEQGGRQTTIALGYFTESYIDFGPYGMFIPIFLVGLAWGLIYRYFLSTSRELIFGYSIVVAVLIVASTFEISAVKMVGGLLMGSIVLGLLQKLLVPSIHRMLEATPPARYRES